jgi:sulfate transport system ATP-binding protein
MQVSIREVTKRFNGFTALDHISLDVRSGEFLALLGPSGSGKTTLLRIIAGLDVPSAGRVLFDEEDTSGRTPGQRRVGFVFQHYALFRHMTVFENVAFGLRVKPRAERPSRSEIRRRVEELVELMHLKGLAYRYPSQLSGGQRQRVALARTLAVGPRVLLLDEPFGALDAKVRTELRRWLRRLHDSIGLTSIFVTHDQEEAMELADRVVVMNQARIEQIGSPNEIHESPASPFVFEFLGSANRIDCRIADGRPRLDGKILGAERQPLPDGPAIAYARPYDVVLADHAAPDDLPAQVRFVAALGPRARVELDSNGLTIEAEVTATEAARLALAAGRRVAVRFKKVRCFPCASTARSKGPARGPADAVEASGNAPPRAS